MKFTPKKEFSNFAFMVGILSLFVFDIILEEILKVCGDPAGASR